MKKIAMVIRITPKTREKLEDMKNEDGLAYGVIVDNLVREEYKRRIDKILTKDTKPVE